MRLLQHPSVLPVMGVVLDYPWPGLPRRTALLVRELCEFGDLAGLLDNKTVEVDGHRMAEIAVKVASGLSYLHKQTPPLTLGDAVAKRVLLDRYFRVRVDVTAADLQRHVQLCAKAGQTGTASARRGNVAASGAAAITAAAVVAAPASGAVPPAEPAAPPATTARGASHAAARATSDARLAGSGPCARLPAGGGAADGDTDYGGGSGSGGGAAGPNAQAQSASNVCSFGHMLLGMFGGLEDVACRSSSASVSLAAENPGRLEGGDWQPEYTRCGNASGVAYQACYSRKWPHQPLPVPLPAPLPTPRRHYATTTKTPACGMSLRHLGNKPSQDRTAHAAPPAQPAEGAPAAAVDAGASEAGDGGGGCGSEGCAQLESHRQGHGPAAAGSSSMRGRILGLLSRNSGSWGTHRTVRAALRLPGASASSISEAEQRHIVAGQELPAAARGGSGSSMSTAHHPEAAADLAVAAAERQISVQAALARVRTVYGPLADLAADCMAATAADQPSFEAIELRLAHMTPALTKALAQSRTAALDLFAGADMHMRTASGAGDTGTGSGGGGLAPATAAHSGAGRSATAPAAQPYALSSMLKYGASRNEALLYDVFPPKVARALVAGEEVQPERYEVVSVLFTDICGYTNLCSQLPALDVMAMLHRLYSAFDTACREMRLFKVETIGDAYMAVSNLRWPQPRTHARLLAQFGLRLVAIANGLPVHPGRPELGSIHIRVGLHCGPVVASCVGTLNRRYCLFGDTVNVASRMESNSEQDRLHCSPSFAAALAEQWPEAVITQRPPMAIKGKGHMTTSWVTAPEGYDPCAHMRSTVAAAAAPDGSTHASSAALGRQETEAGEDQETYNESYFPINRTSPAANGVGGGATALRPSGAPASTAVLIGIGTGAGNRRAPARSTPTISLGQLFHSRARQEPDENA